MPHALATFLNERMLELHMAQADVVRQSGLSRALVSRHVSDKRESFTRLPEKETLEGFARALTVPMDVLIGKAVESLGLGYAAGDFVNSVATSSNRELLAEIERRLDEGGGAHGSAAPNTPPQPDGAKESGKVVRPKFGKDNGPDAIAYDDEVPGPGESTAARDTGQLSEGHKEAEAAEKLGTESQDNDGWTPK